MTSMKTRTRTLLAVAAVTMATAGGGLMTAQTAGAADTRCGNDSVNPHGQSGGIDPNYLVPGTRAAVSTRQVNLYQGREDFRPFRQFAFAQITSGSQQTKGSDRVWMDVEINGVGSQCGPFSVDTAGTIGFTRAKPTGGSNVRMRACGDYVNASGGRTHTCGPWW